MSTGNLLYFFNGDINSSLISGVSKKIFAQMKVFKNNDINVSLITFAGKSIVVFNHKIEIIYQQQLLSTNMWWTNPFVRRILKFRNVSKYIKANEPDVLYLRCGYATPFFINFLRNSKKHVKSIILDLPTYPYDKELRGLVGNFVKNIDKLFRPVLKKYIDIIVSTANYPEIFGIKTINITNGIDLEDVPLSKLNKNMDVFNIIGVANVSFWHGYDRVILGLKEYYTKKDPSDKDVYFHIVGEGQEIPHLKAMTELYGLQNNVIFHGYKSGPELDSIFNNCHVGISSIGIHKLHFSGNPLKSKEYCARGIPFIVEAPEPDFGTEFPYAYIIPCDESPVDIYAIMNFYEQISLDPDYPKKMRLYAEEKLSWQEKMKPLIEVINNIIISQ